MSKQIRTNQHHYYVGEEVPVVLHLKGWMDNESSLLVRRSKRPDTQNASNKSGTKPKWLHTNLVPLAARELTDIDCLIAFTPRMPWLVVVRLVLLFVEDEGDVAS